MDSKPEHGPIYMWAYRLSKAFIWLFNAGVIAYGIYLVYSLG